MSTASLLHECPAVELLLSHSTTTGPVSTSSVLFLASQPSPATWLSSLLTHSSAVVVTYASSCLFLSSSSSTSFPSLSSSTSSSSSSSSSFSEPAVTGEDKALSGEIDSLDSSLCCVSAVPQAAGISTELISEEKEWFQLLLKPICCLC